MSKRKDWSPIANKWIFDPRVACLRIFNDQGGQLYEVPLDELTDSPHVLDWIIQVHGKSWISPESFHTFVEALDYIVGGLQEKYCSFGKGSKVPREVLERSTLGWLIFPESKGEGLPHGEFLSPHGFLERKGKQLDAWRKECKRICEELFGDDE